MNLKDCYIEEDLFPKIFTNFEERDYGILFYNTQNKDSFDSNHAVIYRERIQNQEIMFLKEKNAIVPNPEIEIRKVEKWNEEIENVLVEAEKPWEIMVAKKTLEYPGVWMFAALLKGKPVGLLYGHISEKACRVDYIIVSKKYRKLGAGRAVME